MTNSTAGNGKRMLFLDPVSHATRAQSDKRLARLLIVGSLASFLGFFGLTMISTPPDTTVSANQSAISRSSSSFLSRSDDDDDDDDGGLFSTSSDVRTKTS